MAFPTTPANGATYTTASGINYIYLSDSGWKKQKTQKPADLGVRTDSIRGLSNAQQNTARGNISLPFPYGPHKITVHATSTTHNFDANSSHAFVYVQGGGGAGGGANSETDLQAAAAPGGTGGDCAVKLIDLSSISSATITVGAGGANGGVGIAGANGGNSTYTDGTSTVVGVGGEGAPASASHVNWGTTVFNPVGGSPGSGADWYHYGTIGLWSSSYGDGGTTGTNHRAVGGTGGDSFFGAGARPTECQGSSGTAANGDPGFAYGGGGSGGSAVHNGGGTNGYGGDGANGCIVIWEYQ